MKNYNKLHHRREPLVHVALVWLRQRRAAPTTDAGRAGQPAPLQADLFTDQARRMELALVRTIGLLFALPLAANGLLTLLLWVKRHAGTPGHAAFTPALSQQLLAQGVFALALGLLMLAPFARSRRRALNWAGAFGLLAAGAGLLTGV